MTDEMKRKALEIIGYWKIIDLLGQPNIPKEDYKSKRFREAVYKNEPALNTDKKTAEPNKLEVFIELSGFSMNALAADREHYLYKYPVVGNGISFCVGRLKRNDVVEYLTKFTKSSEERVEPSYKPTDEIAWYSFRTAENGGYEPGSFKISPILWAIEMWSGSSGELSLDASEYDECLGQIDEELSEKDVRHILGEVHKKIFEKYIEPFFPEVSGDVVGFCEYELYKTEKAKEKDEPIDYSDVGRSFFSNDLAFVAEEIDKENFGNDSDYQDAVIRYILAAHDQEEGVYPERTDISPSIVRGSAADKNSAARFFTRILDVENAPLAKWPSKFMPAFMQQAAVNIVCGNEEDVPIFSVNGPPGTGKTTLLKEIVANNIVERAALLAEASGGDPDNAFGEPLRFYGGEIECKDGSKAYSKFAPSYYAFEDDRINDYGILVASCNNAAVQNISVDLPKKDGLTSGRTEGKDKGLDEVSALFCEDNADDDLIKVRGENGSAEKMVKDIFFTRYANALIGKNSSDCWGLVSAPLGKSSNIYAYCTKVLQSFCFEYGSKNVREKHKEDFAKAAEMFSKQMARVKEMRHSLKLLSKAINTPPRGEDDINCDIAAAKKQLDALQSKISAINAEIRKADESLCGFMSILLDKNKIRAEKAAAEKEKAALEAEGARISERITALEREKRNTAAIIDLIKKEAEKGGNGAVVLSPDFWEKYFSPDKELRAAAQTSDPWFTDEYNREREKLFFYACKVHKEFAAGSNKMMSNIRNLLIAWNFGDSARRMTSADKENAFPVLLQSLFVLTPVLSTTFASAQNLLKDVKQSEVIGLLIVDEAGQAPPHMALGSLYRCRSAVIVGDPKQIEPVVTDDTDMFKGMFRSRLIAPYKNKHLSVQGFADTLNPYGTYLGEDEEREWVGCPLIVHRRCLDPMFTISNLLSYDGTMANKTMPPKPKREQTFIFERSCWINIRGSEEGRQDHFVKAQGKAVLKMLELKLKKLDEKEKPDLFIITPFTSVKNGMTSMIAHSALGHDSRIKEWAKENIGTVHTFQGKGAEEVIFLLGCDSSSMSAARWVNKNLVNVAATRAKFRFYVIGNEAVWNTGPVKTARDIMNAAAPPLSLEDFCEIAGITPEELDGRVPSKAPAGAAMPVVSPAKAPAKEEKPSASPVQAPSGKAAPSAPAGNVPICDKCGAPMVLRKKKDDPTKIFYGCSKFPACRNTKPYIKK